MVEHSVELWSLYLRNLENERHEFALKQIKATEFYSQNSSVCSNYGGDEVALIAPKKIDWRGLITSFISEKSLVKEIVNSVKVFWIRDTDSERHITVSEQDLKGEFEIFLENNCGFEVEYSTVQFNKAFRQLTRQTPVIEKANLIKLSENELMFANGYLNLVSNKFYPLDGRKYFNKFSILTDYNSTAPNPDVFDAVLDDMFKGNKDSIQLAYQLIGALISPVSTLKRIYVFQGVSNGGKTRLANIIYQLLEGEGVYSFNTVSDITNDELVKQSYSFRLAYIKDCSRHKLKDKQVSYLKSYADGSRLKNSAVFKILVCTNYKIVTGDNNFLEPALKNRFVTLPFATVMDNSSEEVSNFEEFYFEKEKDGIIKKALQAFSEVLNSGGKFAVDYPINAVVEASSTEDDDDGDVEMAQLSVPNSKIKQVVENIFDFTEDCNLSAKEVFARLNESLPNEVKDPASMGRKLANIFRDDLQSKRSNECTFYNLTYKPLTNS